MYRVLLFVIEFCVLTLSVSLLHTVCLELSIKPVLRSVFCFHLASTCYFLQEETTLAINAIRGGEPHEEHEFKEEKCSEGFKEIRKYLQASWKEGTWSGKNFSNF